MNNIKDLHIEEDILPLFDSTLNIDSKSVVLMLLNNPLPSIESITERQHIFKGFIKNNDVLDTYSYSISYLLETSQFLKIYAFKEVPNNKIIYKFFASKYERAQLKSSLIQMLLLFKRLYSLYFSKLRLTFPENYSKEVRDIIDFLVLFNSKNYEELIREYKFKDSDVISLCTVLAEAKQNKAIIQFWDNLSRFEAFLSISKAITKYNLSFPEFIEKGIELKGFYHPLIEKPVKNDFKESSNVIVLNGANMSGKSTFLKSVGLCIYLGHLGIGIPAKYGAFPFFNTFSIGINHNDDLLNGYSHFMTEIKSLKTVVENASKTSNCFAIFDELFSGTNIEDARELCTTTITGLSQFTNSLFFVSTHIQELKTISHNAIANYYIDCKLVNNTPTFTYKVKQGWSDIKIGQILFEKEGLNTLLKI
jgi:DNA mismatch repair protein MutS